MMNTKSKQHCLDRLRERYNADERIYNILLVSCDHKNRLYFSGFNSIHKINIENIDYFMVYDSFRKVLVTALTEQMVNQSNFKHKCKMKHALKFHKGRPKKKNKFYRKNLEEEDEEFRLLY